MKAYSKCPVCYSGDLSFVMEVKDYSISQETFRISECKNCTLRFTSPVPEADLIGRYYESKDYISHSNTSSGLINRIYQVVRGITLKSKRNLIGNFSSKTKGNLLDFGCGTGEFLNEMQSHGWSVVGLEPSDSAREMGIKNYKLDVKPNSGLSDLPGNHFDVITLWHVLEHVHELDYTMEKINKLLKSGGSLIIAVPNYQSVDSLVYNKFWAAYDVPRHLYHFTKQSMSFLLKRNGFNLMEIGRMPFDSFYVSMLSEKYRGGSLVRAGWVGFRSWLAAFFNPEKCSSIIYLIKKG